MNKEPTMRPTTPEGPMLSARATQMIVAGALYDLIGWLTSRDERITLSSSDPCAAAVMALIEFAELRGLPLDDAAVQSWAEAIATPTGYTDAEQAAWRAGIEAGREIERNNAAASAEPIHQFRVRNCADWYDGLPDSSDGKDYETRTLYSAPVAAQAQPEPLRYGHDKDDSYVTGWNDCVAALRSEQPVSGADGLPEPFAVLAVEKNGSVSVFADSVALSERAIDDGDRAWAASRQARLVEVYTAQPQPSGNAASDDAMERALAELVDKIVPGLDTGDLVADATTASKALDRAQPSGNAGEDERIGFESWAESRRQPRMRNGDGYDDFPMDWAWKAWKARAALAAQASGEDVIPYPYPEEVIEAAMEASLLGRPSVDDDQYVVSILDASRAAAKGEA